MFYYRLVVMLLLIWIVVKLMTIQAALDILPGQ